MRRTRCRCQWLDLRQGPHRFMHSPVPRPQQLPQHRKVQHQCLLQHPPRLSRHRHLHPRQYQLLHHFLRLHQHQYKLLHLHLHLHRL
jgi:hypothetical protein